MLSTLDPDASLWVALGFSIIFILFFAKSRLNYLGIPKMIQREPGENLPDCMVIVPARNEVAVIERVVKSLPPDTVIVVDDSSEDATAEVARKAGAGVMPAPKLPARASGKSNACAAGARALRSRWVLFADADTWFDQGFLETAVQCAEENQISLLSIHLQPEFGSVSENILVPCAVALYFCGVTPSSEAAALVNGQCILARRDAYDFLGGHTAVITSMIDDVKLAALATRHRVRFATVRAGNLGHVRFHPRQLWRGFERNAFRFVMISPWIGATIVAAAFFSALWLPIVAWLVMDRQWPYAVAFALLPSAVLAVWYRNPLRSLLAPLGIYGMFFIIANGLIAVLTGRKIEWKGRVF